MSALTFTLTQRPAYPLDLSPLTPDRLKGKKLSEIKVLELASGNETYKLRDLFDVAGNDPSHIVILRSCDRLYHVGAEMSEGLIEIRGAVGDYLGIKMAGGAIKVRGDTGNWTGGGMSGGSIEIAGNAGDYLGGALPEEPEGMTEGMILVTGDAGDRAGDRMRRGVIVIKGDAGDYCGTRMIAGTIAVFGGVGRFAGLNMKRGSIILGSKPDQITATFNSCGELELSFLPMLFKHLSKNHRALSMLKLLGARAERYAGDMATGGKGELLILRT
jgi:formylmethanofuran dehydrogenase subunit C